MRILYVDLEREWRGGQSQALLTRAGLRQRGHEVELLTARDSPLAIRACSSQRAACVDGRLAGGGAQASSASAFPPNWISTSEKRGVASAIPGRGKVRGEQQRCGTKPD